MVVFLIAIGVFYQSWTTRNDTRRYPPPGNFIHLDGDRKLHYQSFGNETGPLVIFDHGCGIGSSSLIWKLVSDKVSEFARVLVYDRAGYGWSDPGPFPRTNQAAVEDLRILIEKVGMKGPLILVGHSYGGLNVRLFAKQYPELAAGIVLVDATHEEELTDRFPEKYVKGQLMGRKAFKIMKYFCYLGLLRLMGKLHAFKQLDEIVGRMPEEIRSAYQSTLILNKTADAVASEFSHLDSGYNEVRGASLGDTPLVVIKSGIVENLGGFKEEEVTQTKAALLAVAEDMSRLSTKGELWIAENSGHNIHVEDPDIVVKAIEKVLGEI